MRSRHAGLAVLFSLTSFVGAGLLFLVQPMLAKRLLPLFGGTPMVWNTATFFFEAVLLLGYLLTHLSLRRLGVRRHALWQVAAALLPLLALPVGLPADASPGSAAPILQLIGLLAAAVGAPFLLLSTAGPMLQRWFAATTHPRAHDPYFLFAAGNVGSLLALVGYPLLIEPRLGLTHQQHLWSYGYAAWVVLIAACATVVRRTAGAVEQPTAPAPRVPWGLALRWVAIAALASSLMLGTTTYITTDLAPIPLLWVVPLALYLISFIVAFALSQPAARRWAPRLGVLVPVLLIPVIALGNRLGITSSILLALALFTVIATAAHLRLSAERPVVAGMTRFYLLIATGGAIGGAVNGLLGPVLLNRLYEYPAALAVSVLLLPRSPMSSWLRRRYGVVVTALALPLVFVAPVAAREVLHRPGVPILAGFAGAALLAPTMRRHPRALAGGVLVVLTVPLALAPALATTRSFFGAQRVVHEGHRHVLYHGTTVHGWQDLRTSHRHEAGTYYSLDGPIGQVLSSRSDARRIGVVGLGSGALAAYARPGLSMRFFEIDRDSLTIARDPRLFTYLADARGPVDVVLGDGRLTLAKEPAASFDVLVLDAFSSDAVPVHLLTREALRLYLSRLRPGGLVAFHVSNRYLDLRPVLAEVSAAEHATGLWQFHPGDGAKGELSSTWVLVAADPAALQPFSRDSRWQPLTEQRKGRRAWSDEFSNVLQALR